MIGNLYLDLRFGARALRKRPGFTIVTILTLAIGIGSTTAIFSIADAVLFRPLPFKDSDRLVQILSAQVPRVGPSKLFDSYRDFEYWRDHNQSFEQIEACTWIKASQTLMLNGRAEKVLAVPASAGFLSLLGVPAAKGRTFDASDVSNGPAIVLSYGFWQTRLGADPDVIGSNLTVGGVSRVVLGVMPASFNFYPKQTEMWSMITPGTSFDKDRLNSLVIAYGRLKPGVSMAAAEAELAALHHSVIAESPSDSWIAHVEPVVDSLQEDLTWLAGRNLRTGLLVLLGAVGFLLLIACVNVANLLLGRSVERQKEFAIRSALGSSRLRLIRQLVTESILLSACGAIPGIGLAIAAVSYFRATTPIELPPGNPLEINLRVLAFAVALTLVIGCLFGVLPAIRASKANLAETLKDSSRSTSGGALGQSLGRILIVAEVTLSLVLLTSAGLLIQSMFRISSASLGFRIDHLLTARVELPSDSYVDVAARTRYYESLLSRFNGVEGVNEAAASSSVPLSGPGTRALKIDGEVSDEQTGGIGDVGTEIISDNYFRVMGIPLFRGREFDSSDRADTQPVAMISEALANEYFPGEDPIGRRVRIDDRSQQAPWLTIVGVVGDVKRTTVYKEMDYVVGPFVFEPLAQAAPASMGLAIRTARPPSELAKRIEDEASSLDPKVPLSDVQTMQSKIADFLASARFRAKLLGLFASIALALAAVGIYGVLSQFVARRMHEMGIRLALGAKPSDVLWLVIRQGMFLALAGIVIGTLAAVAFGRLLTSLLYGVTPTDSITIALTVMLLGTTALAACYIPARRATRVDPMIALRCE